MADNTTLNPGSSGDVIRDLARSTGASSGSKTQVVQLDLGGANTNAEVLITAGQQTMSASVPVAIASNQSAVSVTDTADGTPGSAPPSVVTMVGATDGTTARAVVTSLKGTQGGYALATQDLKDSGRTYLAFTADRVAGVTTETLVTVTQNKAGTTSSVSSYTVTSGKTLRLQSFSATILNSSTAAAYGRVRLRTAASSIATTSPLLMTIDLGTYNSTAVAGAGQAISVPIPDGLEIASGQQIALSQIVNTTSSTVSVTLVGYEY